MSKKDNHSNPRRLLIFFDGTWNSPDQGDEPTNVVKLLRCIPSHDSQGISQIVFYDKGVGSGNFQDRIAGGASGAGLTENVVDGYRFLANNYAPGDEIYIFGFSRGAYTARSLVGFISVQGLLFPAFLGKKLKQMISICQETPDKKLRKEQIAKLKVDGHKDVRIHCVGVWDTVGSLGIPGDLGRRLLSDPYHFHDVGLSKKVDVALHAIAIDEKRSAFAPTLWVKPKNSALPENQIVEQVWFSGVHSNIGGSYTDTGLSDITLDWMAKRLKQHTPLQLDDAALLATICNLSVQGRGYESRSGLYLSSKAYPYQRLIKQTIPEGFDVGDWFREKFPSADRRNIIPDNTETIHEALHVSALERWKASEVLHDCNEDSRKKQPYRPINLRAVIQAKNIDVVDWDGNIIPKDEVQWPDLDRS